MKFALALILFFGVRVADAAGVSTADKGAPSLSSTAGKTPDRQTLDGHGHPILDGHGRPITQ